MPEVEFALMCSICHDSLVANRQSTAYPEFFVHPCHCVVDDVKEIRDLGKEAVDTEEGSIRTAATAATKMTELAEVLLQNIGGGEKVPVKEE